MPRYIDAESLVAIITKMKAMSKEKVFEIALEGFEEAIQLQPTADVQEVKHGYWKQNQYHKNIYYCSECGRHIEDRSDNPYEHFPYCHCGAKMDLKEGAE